MHSRFSLYDDGLIEIWEYRGEQKTRSICKIKEESETEYYKAKQQLKAETATAGEDQEKAHE